MVDVILLVFLSFSLIFDATATTSCGLATIISFLLPILLRRIELTTAL